MTWTCEQRTRAYTVPISPFSISQSGLFFSRYMAHVKFLFRHSCFWVKKIISRFTADFCILCVFRHVYSYVLPYMYVPLNPYFSRNLHLIDCQGKDDTPFSIFYPSVFIKPLIFLFSTQNKHRHFKVFVQSVIILLCTHLVLL